MKIRPTMLLLASATVAAAGCSGPTNEGLQARSDAYERVNRFHAQFTYDAAKQDFETGEFDRALRNCEAAIAENPRAVKFHLLRGRVLLEMNRLEDALGAFNRAIEEAPELADAQYYAAIVYQRWSDDDEAYRRYLKAYELDRDNVQYLLATAEALVSLGELAEARKLVESRMSYFEHDPALRHLLGQISLLEGDAKTAARYFEEARLLSPDDVALLEELAWVQYDAELYGRCYETVQELQARQRDERVDILHLEARCLTMLERTSEAHKQYMDLTRLNPSNASLWIEFGTLAWKLGDFRRVAQCSARTIEIAPNRFEGYMLKGLYERNHGRFDQAIDLFERATKLAGHSALPHMLLGNTLEQAGRATDALRAYNDAIAIDPQNRQARIMHDRLEATIRIATGQESGPQDQQ